MQLVVVRRGIASTVPIVKSGCQERQGGGVPGANVGFSRVPGGGVPGSECRGAVAFCSSYLPSGEFSVVENANP